MGFLFHFTQLGDMKELDQLIAFLREQDLGYPRYQEWVDRTRSDLFCGQKDAVLAFSYGVLVGDWVYRMNGDVPGLADLRNMRIHPNVRDRGFARFGLRQIEHEATNAGKYGVICDARADKPELVRMMNHFGYRPLFPQPISLYESNAGDIPLVKFFPQAEDHKQKIISLAQNRIVRLAA